MPKGKKKGKKKSGKKGKKGDKENSAKNDSDKTEISLANEEEDDIFEDKEQQLKDKLFKVNIDIGLTKTEIEEMKDRIKKMEEECEQIANEAEAFSSYLQQMESYRKDNLVTLQDYYRDRIDCYNADRNDMMNQYDLQRTEIREKIEKKQLKITRLQEEIKEYDEYLVRQEEQKKEIKLLESEIQLLRCQQAEELDQIKRELFEDNEKFQRSSNEKINEIAQAAFKDALESLSTACSSIQSENRELRREMLWTIKQNEKLKERKLKQLEQNRILKEELQFAQDFAMLRKIRQEKPMQLNKMKEERK